VVETPAWRLIERRLQQRRSTGGGVASVITRATVSVGIATFCPHPG
jgi:hypothetical protein